MFHNFFCKHLQIFAQIVKLIHNELNVLFVNPRIGNDIAKEVGKFPLWLIAHQEVPLLNHLLRDFGLAWAQFWNSSGVRGSCL